MVKHGTQAFVIRTGVTYTTGATGDLEFLVLARNSQHAVKVLLDSSEFPKSNVTVNVIVVKNYYGELVIDRN